MRELAENELQRRILEQRRMLEQRKLFEKEIEGVRGDSLYYSSKGLTKIYPGVFDSVSMHNLHQLTLSHNQLTSLCAGGFKDLNNLQELGLDNNKLTSFPADAFSGLYDLQWLRLDNNNLTSLPARIFRALNNLQELHLDDHKLTAENIDEIRSVLPVNCRITH